MISMTDLERYCYFVAGTVGHLITELFDEATDFSGLESRLRNYAESFGLGLQLVNIVKDVTDDFDRGICYLPRQTCRAEGIEPEQLLAPEKRAAAKRVAGRVIDQAAMHLDAALEYTLCIPKEHHHLRLFCLLPLWMALETLALARDNDAIFETGKKVKITRESVGRIIADCGRDCRDDDALRAAYFRLKSGTMRIAVAN
jgi:farnesyl-diphosphate farnesyltransferase